MTQRDRKLVEEIKWMIKLRTPKTVLGLISSSSKSMEEASGEISDFIRSENIKPIIQLHDPVKLRFLIVLGVDPPWGFALKKREDDWDYMEVIENLKGIIGGKEN